MAATMPRFKNLEPGTTDKLTRRPPFHGALPRQNHFHSLTHSTHRFMNPHEQRSVGIPAVGVDRGSAHFQPNFLKINPSVAPRQEQVSRMADNGEQEHSSHRPGAMRRALAKVKNTAGHAHEPKPSHVDYQDELHPHPHPRVEGVVNTVGYSLIQEIVQYLKGPDGEEAMEVIFSSQSRVAARLALTEETKLATRIAAEEATTGTYDGVHHKCLELFASLPTTVLTVGSVLLGSYFLLLSVGVLFSLWRFALFGLQ